MIPKYSRPIYSHYGIPNITLMVTQKLFTILGTIGLTLGYPHLSHH